MAFSKTIVEVRVSTRGRITIPKTFRKQFELSPSGLVRFTIQDDGRVTIASAKTVSETKKSTNNNIPRKKS
jgi:AbrB family looped-hinge helix DNA binding protein